MTDKDDVKDFNGPTIDHDPNEPPRAGSSWTVKSVTVAVAAVVLAGAGVAIARGAGWGPGDGWGPGGMGHRMMAGFAERRMEHVMDEIDATDEQQDRIWAIIDAARAELRPVGRDFRDSREEIVKLLGEPTIDRAAAEALRAERIAALDEASKKATAALLDAAEVLTPQQRAKLVEHYEERRGWRH